MTEFDVVLLPAAIIDLNEIFDYILAENRSAASVTLEHISQSLYRLKNHPRSGSPLLDSSLVRFHFRIVVIRPYIAFYRVVGEQIMVYRILHGARNYPNLLREN